MLTKLEVLPIDFLQILEQYLILLLRPTLNKLLIPVKGGSKMKKLDTGKKGSMKKFLPIYCYFVEKTGENGREKYFFLHKVESTLLFSKICQKYLS